MRRERIFLVRQKFFLLLNWESHTSKGCRESRAKSAAEANVQCRLNLYLSWQHQPAARWPSAARVALIGQARQLGAGGGPQSQKTGDYAFFQHVQNMSQVVYKMPTAVW